MKTKTKGRPKGSTATLTRPLHIKFSQGQYDAIKEAADADSRPVVQWLRLAAMKVAEEQKASRTARMP
jgi:uncharacterized protein (DUF1778 family)